MMFGTRESFSYFSCQLCGCLQITQIPANLAQYYPDNYYSINSGTHRGQRQKHLPWVRVILEQARAQKAILGTSSPLSWLAPHLVDLPPEIYPVGNWLKTCGIGSRHASFLDVGCGSSSWWLNSLRTLGFRRLLGVDPYISSDVTSNGVTIRRGVLADIDGKFDLISFHHSFEHIPEQLQTLEAVRRLLRPNGYCLIRIPVVSSMVWEMYGTDWVELDAPRHLYLHSKQSIQKIAEKSGFKLVTSICDSSEFEFYGSEQYRRDIPLTSIESYWINPATSSFTYREMASFRELAERANREGTGGRACFFFKLK
jgi:SAM-dependent methyltransferase